MGFVFTSGRARSSLMAVSFPLRVFSVENHLPRQIVEMRLRHHLRTALGLDPPAFLQRWTRLADWRRHGRRHVLGVRIARRIFARLQLLPFLIRIGHASERFGNAQNAVKAKMSRIALFGKTNFYSV